MTTQQKWDSGWGWKSTRDTGSVSQPGDLASPCHWATGESDDCGRSTVWSSHGSILAEGFSWEPSRATPIPWLCPPLWVRAGYPVAILLDIASFPHFCFNICSPSDNKKKKKKVIDIPPVLLTYLSVFLLTFLIYFWHVSCNKLLTWQAWYSPQINQRAEGRTGLRIQSVLARGPHCPATCSPECT